MSNEIINVLNAICDKVGLTIDWTSKNIMPYLEQLINRYVTYEIINAILIIVFNLIFMVATILIGKAIIPKLFKRFAEDYDEIGSLITAIILSVIAVGIVMSAFWEIYSYIDIIIQCCYIPELRFLKFVKEMKNFSF